MGKHAIRQQLLTRRRQLEESIRFDLSARAQQKVLSSDRFSHAEILALYSPVNNEVCTDRILTAALDHGKQVCFPRVCGEVMQFVAINSEDDLQAGAFGVAEPIGEEVLSAGQIDLIVVPGVAFDRNGFRLGYGKGFYDRELSQVPQATVSIGLCYDFQLCEALPVEGHDQSLDYIATETQLIPCHKEVAGSP